MLFYLYLDDAIGGNDNIIDDIPRLLKRSLLQDCPLEMPNTGDACTFEGDCYFGTESCCNHTFPKQRCSCFRGSAECSDTESCGDGCDCSLISIICPDGTVVKPDPNNNCTIPDCPVDISCPATMPNFGDFCTFEGNCEYGTESCCNQTFPAIQCTCSSNCAVCYPNHFCHICHCPPGSVICADGTILEPDPDNDCEIADCPVDISCPAQRPNTGDSCTFEGDCDYGTESCCGEIFPQIRCSCDSGTSSCLNTNSCTGECPP